MQYQYLRHRERVRNVRCAAAPELPRCAFESETLLDFLNVCRKRQILLTRSVSVATVEPRSQFQRQARSATAFLNARLLRVARTRRCRLGGADAIVGLPIPSARAGHVGSGADVLRQRFAYRQNLAQHRCPPCIGRLLRNAATGGLSRVSIGVCGLVPVDAHDMRRERSWKRFGICLGNLQRDAAMAVPCRMWRHFSSARRVSCYQIGAI